jgi:uncharacterized membrane protein (UPF0127 family)
MGYNKGAMRVWIILVLLLGVLGVSWYASESVFSKPLALQTGNFTQVMIGTHMLRVEVVDTEAGRAQGLSNRNEIGSDGMLFIFQTPGVYPFWMKDMRFPIDIVWLSGGTVLGFVDSAASSSEPAPPIYPPPGPVDRVLELPAGSARTYGIEAGSKINIKQAE